MTSSNPLATALRTHLCGALREAHVGQTVRVGGWVHRTRNLGGLVFVDLRDRAGLLQVSFAPGSATAEALQVAERLTPETVVLIEGEVVARPSEGHNPELETGAIELRAVHARDVTEGQNLSAWQRVPLQGVEQEFALANDNVIDPGTLLKDAMRIW